MLCLLLRGSASVVTPDGSRPRVLLEMFLAGVVVVSLRPQPVSGVRTIALIKKNDLLANVLMNDVFLHMVCFLV